MRNYFKTSAGAFVFFFGNVLESVEDAYAAVTLQAPDEQPVLFAPVAFAGPWQACPIVGHRRREDIAAELVEETDEEAAFRLAEELLALDERTAQRCA